MEEYLNQMKATRLNIVEKIAGLIGPNKGEESIKGYCSILQQIADLQRPPGSADSLILQEVELLEKKFGSMKNDVIDKLSHLIQVPIHPSPTLSAGYESDDLQKAFRPICPKNWTDIHGLEDVKHRIETLIILPLQKPAPFHGPKTFLFYGPSGCGKSLAAESVSRNVTKCSVLSLDVSAFCRKTSEFVNNLFLYATNKEPSIIIIKDLDQLPCLSCMHSDQSLEHRHQSLKTSFFQLLDKIQAKASIRLIVVSKQPWNMDPDFIQKFEEKILFPLPPFDVIKRILECGFAQGLVESTVDLTKVATGLDGLSVKGVLDFLNFVKKNSNERSMMREGCFSGNLGDPIITEGDLDIALAQQHQHVLSAVERESFTSWE